MAKRRRWRQMAERRIHAQLGRIPIRGKRRRNVHVLPAGERRKFVARVAGDVEAFTEPTTQREAIRAAIREAKLRLSEVVIHRGDGRIRDSDSYGGDPEEVRDSKH